MLKREQEPAVAIPAIAANCVATRDVPPGAVVVGVPGRVVSHEGSCGYIQHTDYAMA